MASNIIDARAGKNNQARRCSNGGRSVLLTTVSVSGASFSACTATPVFCVACRPATMAKPAQRTTYNPNPNDHTKPCAEVVSCGSTRNGKVNSAPNEPTFDNEYRRYGEVNGYTRANQACTSGPVDERMKYGKPTLASSNVRMRRVGCVPSAGFQAVLGVMGSVHAASTSKPTCNHVCNLRFEVDMRKWQ